MSPIVSLINLKFDGLKTDIITMLSGERVKVKTKTYQNDMVTFKNKDDVMTSLIHLGYLAYDQKNQMAFIPNEEIRSEFLDVLEENKWSEFIEFQRASETLLEVTLDMDEEAVAEGIEKIHTEYASSIQYNNENSLSSVLTIAYLSAMQYYFKLIREMPAGMGFADFVFIPKTEYIGEYPALLVELKWNKNVKTAIQQIKEKSTHPHWNPIQGIFCWSESTTIGRAKNINVRLRNLKNNNGLFLKQSHSASRKRPF